MILGIYGSGGLGREVLDLAYVINTIDKKWTKIMFIDDFATETAKNGAEIVSFDRFVEEVPVTAAKIVIAVGEPAVRHSLREKITSRGYLLQTLIHPSAFIGTDTAVGEGAIVQFGSFVSCNVRVGTNVLLQSYSTVGHDTVVGNDTVISTFVAISGTCTIGERAYIGVSVPVKEKACIGSDSIVGMGSAVLRDIPPNVIAIGNPARAMKPNDRRTVFN